MTVWHVDSFTCCPVEMLISWPLKFRLFTQALICHNIDIFFHCNSLWRLNLYTCVFFRLQPLQQEIEGYRGHREGEGRPWCGTSRPDCWGRLVLQRRTHCSIRKVTLDFIPYDIKIKNSATHAAKRSILVFYQTRKSQPNWNWFATKLLSGRNSSCDWYNARCHWSLHLLAIKI